MTVLLILVETLFIFLISVLFYSLGKAKGLESAKDLSISAENLIKSANSTIELCEKMAETNKGYKKLVEDQYELWQLTCKSLNVKLSRPEKADEKAVRSSNAGEIFGGYNG